MSETPVKSPQLGWYYTPQEVARKLRISVPTVYRKLSSGEILGVRPAGGTAIRIPRWWLDQHREEIERAAIEEFAIDPAVKMRKVS
jgi:excisionase family DNA binding protein